MLPFKYSGGNADLTALAEGLTEEIVTGLSRFSYLKVISRSSTSRYAKESADVRSAGKELGARYIIEGSLRHSGKKVRLSVQLVDAVSGAQLWAENYERNFSPEAVFQLQDDLVPRIVSTVADTYGVLPYSMSDLVRSKAPDQLTPYEALLRGIGYGYRLTPEEHAAARTCMERAMQQAPGYADGWAMLSFLYQEEYGFGFNPQPDPLERALQAARRATDAAPSNAFAQTALARTLFFRKEFQAFRTAAEQAITLNPMDGAMLANVGTMLAYSGDWERGCALIEKAMQLNPRHPGWYWFPFFYNAYRQRDYRGALSVVLKINLPGFFATHEGLAAVHGQLGERGAASQSLKEMLKLVPNFAEIARVLKSKWFDSELVEHLLDGLRKAGLKIPPNEATSPAVKSSDSKTASTEDGFWVAVLPFKYIGGNADLTALADGMTEEIVTGLSRFSYLRVIALGSTTRYANQAVDIRSAGKELGARYVMEGSLRQAGARLRVAVQLVDTISGAHLWAETYDRAFAPEEIFTLQDDLVPRIVSTVADMHGVLPRSMSEVVRQKSADQMSPYEALLRSFGYNERFTPEDLAEVRACLERAVQQAPNNAECWAMLSLMYANEYGHWDNATPDSLDRSLRAARKAVEGAPLHSLPYYALAQALYFKKEFTEFRVAADRAISLNPMDGATAAFMGMLIAYSGDWECGCALSDKGCQLNPNHPGWYCYPAWHDSYRKKDYRKALDLAFQLNAPQNYYTHAVLAMCYAQLGRMEEARKALRDMLALKPNYAEVARELHGRWIQSDLVEQLMDGLRKAGLEIPPREGEKTPAADLTGSSQPSSGTVGADEGFWVAVLPFIYRGSNPDLTALTEGLTEEIVTGLSRFSYLKVISRSSASRYASESVNVRSAGKELGARYIIEGSLRQAGNKVRLAVQLVDAVSGAQLWAENYERSFSPEALFELQDELVPRIVSTVADAHGVLPRNMSELLRNRNPEELTPYEAVLRSFGYAERMTASELAAARSGLEAAVRKAPDYADAWAMLAFLCIQDYAQGLNLQSDSLTRGRTAAQRAVETAPSNHLAYAVLAQALFFQREFQGFRNAAERAVALNSMDGDSIAFLGELLTYAGDWDRGLALAGRAKQLNPHHPGWYWYADFYNAYRQGDDRGGLGFALKINIPGHWFMHAAMCACYGQIGERDAADKALQDLLRVRPNWTATVRKDIEKWWEPEYVERLIDGWRKAGVQTVDKAGAPTAVKTPDLITPRSDEAFWVAVLPFIYSGNNSDLTALADGLTEEVVTGLSQFSYLKVIARSSTSRYSKEAIDVRLAGKELGARYVMEGSVRQAGTKLRLAVQLVDASSGAHLWAENYERTFSPETVFELQDDLAPRIVPRWQINTARWCIA